MVDQTNIVTEIAHSNRSTRNPALRPGSRGRHDPTASGTVAHFLACMLKKVDRGRPPAGIGVEVMHPLPGSLATVERGWEMDVRPRRFAKYGLTIQPEMSRDRKSEV